MKKKLKWIAIGLPILLLVGIALMVMSNLSNHRQLVEEEKEAYPPPGTLVEIGDNGDKLHVFSKGGGSDKATLVFMAGLGTSSPVFAFQELYSYLSDDYRIAVVERAGYGWSNITSSPRDIDTVLEETRTALQKSGESAPYVLFPHSMAGVEALYWAGLYPDEVKAIVGIDAGVPQFYAEAELTILSPVITFLANTGMMRSQPDICHDNVPAISEGQLTGQEVDMACALFYRRTQTDNMLEEADLLKDNSELVLAEDKPDVPLYFFISARGGDRWNDMLTSYAGNAGGEYHILDADHYLHNYEAALIAEKSRVFIERID